MKSTSKTAPRIAFDLKLSFGYFCYSNNLTILKASVTISLDRKCCCWCWKYILPTLIFIVQIILGRSGSQLTLQILRTKCGRERIMEATVKLKTSKGICFRRRLLWFVFTCFFFFLNGPEAVKQTRKIILNDVSTWPWRVLRNMWNKQPRCICNEVMRRNLWYYKYFFIWSKRCWNVTFSFQL